MPLELFQSPALPASAPCDTTMDRSYEIVGRHRAANTINDDKGKVSPALLLRVGRGRLLGPPHRPEVRRPGRAVPAFTNFLTKMATRDAMIAGLASIHGCIGAVDPVRTFGTPDQKQRFLPKLASGQALSGFALTEPGAGSDLTALKQRRRSTATTISSTAKSCSSPTRCPVAPSASSS